MENEIIKSLLAKSIYVRSPRVDISPTGKITTGSELDQVLYVWFDQEDKNDAEEQVKVVDNHIICGGFSRSNHSLVKNTNRNPFEAQDICNKLIGSEMPLESAAQIADHLPGYAWTVERAYDLEFEVQKFEAANLALIGAQVNLTPGTFKRYLDYLGAVRTNLVTYFGNRVSFAELDEFAEKYPDLWWKWGDFFLDDGNGKEELPVLEATEVAKGFVYQQHALFQDEIKRIRDKQKLEFLIPEEILVR